MTHRQKRFRHVGWSLALSGFLLTLLISTFAPIIFTQQAHALDSGGQATWYDPYTIDYTDTPGHTLRFIQAKSGDVGFYGLSSNETLFNSVESLDQYKQRVSGDTDIC